MALGSLSSSQEAAGQIMKSLGYGSELYLRSLRYIVFLEKVYAAAMLKYQGATFEETIAVLRAKFAGQDDQPNE